jgi:hypothetical protein
MITEMDHFMGLNVIVLLLILWAAILSDRKLLADHVIRGGLALSTLNNSQVFNRPEKKYGKFAISKCLYLTSTPHLFFDLGYLGVGGSVLWVSCIRPGSSMTG